MAPPTGHSYLKDNTMKTTLDIQRRLKELGFDPGPLDGLRGRQTINAVER
jgi:peptidoglycan hydrolase-like protein with peptidoglycan-binding domain